jgi:cyclopropane fatty-acyl-phospholipid synthase-like methyltransferase
VAQRAGLLMLRVVMRFRRDCPGLGGYNKVVSIEMIEAVGAEHLGSYFATINAALKPGGKAVIQVMRREPALAVWMTHAATCSANSRWSLCLALHWVALAVRAACLRTQL